MTQAEQGTIRQAISFQGKGLHTGKKARITIHPADENTGIIFQRTDRRGKNTQISAHWENTVERPLCTCIQSSNKVSVRTIEHLMAAFYACGIDNALIEINGSEVPILDGSASLFVEGIHQVGVQKQKVRRRLFQVVKELQIKEKKREITIEPAKGLQVDIVVLISEVGRKHWHGEINPAIFSEQISLARTFGHLKDGVLAQLTRFSRVPVCLGANLNTAVVLGKNGRVLNKEGLRTGDEFVKHRLLDLVGDLMLLGGHIEGKISTVGPVHRLTHQLLRKGIKEGAIIEVPYN